MPQTRAYAAVAVTLVLWASAFVAIRHLGEDFHPGTLSLGRQSVAAIALAFVVPGRTHKGKSSRQCLHHEGPLADRSDCQALSCSSQPRKASRFLVDSPRERRHSHSLRIDEAKPSSRIVLNDSSA
jgi:hypothetical protein